MHIFQHWRHFIVCQFLLTLSALSFGADEIWKPEPLQLNEVVAYAAVPDLKSLAATVDKIASANVPKEYYKSGTVPMLLGAVAGDPDMKNIGAKPIVGVLFKSNDAEDGAPYALYLPAGLAAATVEEVFKARELLTLVKENVVIVAPSEKVLGRARDAFGEYKQIAESKLTADMRLFIDIQRAMEPQMAAFDKGIRELIEKSEANFGKDLKEVEALGIKFDVKSMLQIVHLGCAMVEGCVKASERAQIDLKLTPDTLAFDTHFAAKEDSALGAFLTGLPSEPDPKLHALVCNSAETMRFIYNQAALVAALRRVRGELLANPRLKEFADSDLMLSLIEETESRGSETLFGGTEPFAEMPVILHTVSDEKKYLAARKKKFSFLAPDSALGKLCTSVGARVESKFEKTSRAHREVPIFAEDFVVDMTQIRPEIKMMMKAPAQDQDVHTEGAVVGKIFAESGDPDALKTTIERILDGKRSETPLVLKSEKHFGKGKQVYWESDVIGNDPGADKELWDKPMMFAMGYDKGRAKMQFFMSFKPVTFRALQVLRLLGILPTQKNPETNDGKF